MEEAVSTCKCKENTQGQSTCQKMGKAICGRTRCGKKNGQAGLNFDLVQKMLGLCKAEDGTEIDELLQAGASRHKRVRQDVEKKFRSLKTAGSLPRMRGIGRLKDKREGSQGKEKGDNGMNSRRERFMGQKGLWDFDRDKLLQDRGALPEEDGDIVREYKAMHQEHFPCCWPREDVKGTEERRKNREEKAREEESRSGNSWREKRRKRLLLKEGVSTLFLVMLLRDSVTVKIRMILRILGMTFWVTPVVLSDCVPVVSDVPVSPSSTVVVMSEALVSDSDWEIV